MKRPKTGPFLSALLVFVVTLGLLFVWTSLPGYTLANNDGPLGALMAKCHQLPGWFHGGWEDLNTVGYRGGGGFASITFGLMWALGPLLLSKFYAPLAILLLGIAAWCFFRQMKFTPLACLLGGLAAMLNSAFFSVACWGIAAHTNTIAMTFFALACLANNTARWRWLRVVVAGLAVGMGIAEGADVGAIFSVYVAAFAFWQAFTMESNRPKNVAVGVLRIAVVAIFAAFMAAQPISTLVQTAIKGIAGTKQDEESKSRRWDFSTQWSLPKQEALGLIIPGLFGYRMDTPKQMAILESAYEGGAYWGAVGRDPGLARAIEQWRASGKTGAAPSGMWRFTGGGNYAGILVVVAAIWALAQSFQRGKSVYTVPERKWIWFWGVIAVISLLLSFGYYAPFYRLFYALPYASTIRNPAKFVHGANLAIVALFGFGIQGFCRRYLEITSVSRSSFKQHWKAWWSKTSGFERKWVWGGGLTVGLSLLCWLIFASSRQGLEAHMQIVGFDAETARKLAGFSLREVGLYVFFLACSVGLIAAISSKWFAGPRRTMAAVGLTALLIIDFGRANLPWIIKWNYKQKYASNPIIDFLREKPYEHRVVGLPAEFARDPRFVQAFHIPEQWTAVASYFMQIYGAEWTQHLFLYYNVQSLDVVQMPRKPEDLEAYDQAFLPSTGEEVTRFYARRWELTNTRYILGATAYLQFLNQVVDPVKHRFRVVQEFNIEPKPGITSPKILEELTATPATNGNFAVFEFTGALPRAQLYSDWTVNTNREATLQKLVSRDFDPTTQVLIAEPVPASDLMPSTNDNAGTVEFASYDPNDVVLHTKANHATMLLLNDRYDPNWHLTVDGKPAPLLHANYLMRAVRVPSGDHLVEMRFAPSMKMFYVSFSAVLLGLCLIGFLAVAKNHDAHSEVAR